MLQKISQTCQFSWTMGMSQINFELLVASASRLKTLNCSGSESDSVGVEHLGAQCEAKRTDGNYESE